MEHKRYGDAVVVRMDSGEDIVEKVAEIAGEYGISTGMVGGIGAVDDFTIGCYDVSTKQYVKKHFTGPHEVTSLLGNVTRRDGKPHVHLHITCGDSNGNVVGGHLINARISITGEIAINIIDGKVGRKLDDAVGTYKMSF